MPSTGPTADAASDGSSPPPQGLQVVTTVGSEADAAQLAEALIQQRLAACVQIDAAIRSYYRWQDRVEVDTEWRLTIKTTRHRWDAVRHAILQRHPYELPEIIATEITLASPEYLRWMAEQVDAGDLRFEV